MMNLYVILISVVLWNNLAPVESRFFLETIKPSADITDVIKTFVSRSLGEKTGLKSGAQGDEKGFTVELYECEAEKYKMTFQVVCARPEPEEKQRIYSVVNFNSVSRLEVAAGNVYRIETDYYYNYVPQAIAIGVEPEDDWYLKDFIPTQTHSSYANQVYDYLHSLLDSGESSNVPTLFQFFRINQHGHFGRPNVAPRPLLASYVAALRKIINASGYNKEPGSPTGVEPQPKAQPRPLSVSLSKPLSSPPRKATPRSRSIFQAIARSLSRSPCRFLPSPKPKSSSRVQPQTKTDPAPPSPPRPQPLTRSEIVESASLLAFKMFDPCYVYLLVYIGQQELDSYCSTYCQFIGATLQVYGKDIAKECENLQTGFCEDEKCLCGRSPFGKPVNMAKCNNSLRLYIYDEVRVQKILVE